MSAGPPVPDGTYDVLIFEAAPHPDHPDSVVNVEITIVSGDLKGEVLKLGAQGIDGNSIDLMGMPATLSVAGGIPTLTIDPG